jgi:hypothetical protein
VPQEVDPNRRHGSSISASLFIIMRMLVLCEAKIDDAEMAGRLAMKWRKMEMAGRTNQIMAGRNIMMQHASLATSANQLCPSPTPNPKSVEYGSE